MARCGCSGGQQCLSANEGNLAFYDETGCLYVGQFTPDFGGLSLPVSYDLTGEAEAAWADTGLELSLPAAGTYQVTADAFAHLYAGVTDPAGTMADTLTLSVLARLWNETTSSLVTNGSFDVVAAGANRAGRYETSGGASITRHVTASGPTLLKLQSSWTLKKVGSGTMAGTVLIPTYLAAAGSAIHYTRIG